MATNSPRPSARVRCRHAFEFTSVHANGEVVCSIIDGRGDFVLGNVHQQSIRDIVNGDRARQLRALVLSSADSYCPAIGKECPLKTIPVEPDREPAVSLRFLAIEPTTACDLRCLSCPVRDFSSRITWRDAYTDGGLKFLAWDGVRRGKQHAADAVRRALPMLEHSAMVRRTKAGALLMRGRMPKTRTGTLPIEVLKRVLTDAGPGIERLDLYQYGEPFLYRHLVDALRHARAVMPAATLAISTDGMQVRPEVEAQIVSEGLLDWILFSIDGCDNDSYRRYRIGGQFDVAFGNMTRFFRRAAGTPMHVIWQYVVFEWNDRDDQLRRAIDMAHEIGITLWFDFANTWGRSRRRAEDLRYVAPYLKPFTALPGEPRQEGW